MKIIISPAKKMKQDADSFDCHGLPQLLHQTEQLYQQLCRMSYAELKRLWCCNDQIATLNYERLQKMDLHRNLTPAVMSYEGIQYRYMAPSVLTDKELAYLEQNLRILSGFYGILRPFDGVTPYRLEMQAKLSVNGCHNLYEFWKDIIAQSLFSETDMIVNLASKEYSELPIRALRPTPAQVAKVSNKYRYKLMIKCKNNLTFRTMLSRLLVACGKEKAFAGVTVYADSNPDMI